MRTRQLRNDILELFHEKIEYMEWLPGSSLNEVKLCEEMQTSRTPIREALILLQGEQLVEVFPQRGTFVTKIDISYIQQLSYMRHAIEKQVLLDMIGHAEGLYQQIEIILASQRINQKNNDIKAFMKDDDRFHETLFRVAGHTELWEIIRKTSRQRNRYRWLKANEIGLQPTLDQHIEIVRCIELGDREKLLELLILHHSISETEMQFMKMKYQDYFSE